VSVECGQGLSACLFRRVLGFSVSFVRLFPPLLFVAHLDPYDLDEPHLGASIQIFDPFLLRSLSV